MTPHRLQSILIALILLFGFVGRGLGQSEILQISAPPSGAGANQFFGIFSTGLPSVQVLSESSTQFRKKPYFQEHAMPGFPISTPGHAYLLKTTTGVTVLGPPFNDPTPFPPITYGWDVKTSTLTNSSNFLMFSDGSGGRYVSITVSSPTTEEFVYDKTDYNVRIISTDTLSIEYTTGQFLADFIARAKWTFSDAFTPDYKFAERELPPDEYSYSVTKIHYKIRIPPSYTGTLQWIENFVPEDITKPKEPHLLSAFTAAPALLDTSIYAIDPLGSDSLDQSISFRHSNINGRYNVAVLNADIAVDANRDGNIKFSSQDSSDLTEVDPDRWTADRGK